MPEPAGLISFPFQSSEMPGNLLHIYRTFIGHDIGYPLRHIIIDRDVIQGGTSSLVTKVPLIIPISAPTHKGTRIAANVHCTFVLPGYHTPLLMAPTDKSMHPVMITNVIPTAMTPIMLDCLNRFIRLIE